MFGKFREIKIIGKKEEVFTIKDLQELLNSLDNYSQHEDITCGHKGSGKSLFKSKGHPAGETSADKNIQKVCGKGIWCSICEKFNCDCLSSKCFKGKCGEIIDKELFLCSDCKKKNSLGDKK